ncbi:MAG: glutamine-synthetase adenylyltransferase, partial [Alphaproteobacteria bacterium]|nr:glutamine-synthetase adenylyltransferase [Alphaproteobacteria bacterium]
AGLAAELAQVMTNLRDFEDALDKLRRWAREKRFQVGVQLLRRALDGAHAGAALADIAETAIAALLPRVEADFARRHGRVPGGAFAVIGMGRLGSREMTLASDLDLILIYDAPPGTDSSDGPHPLQVSAYFARLSQRLISAITAATAEGRLYDVDMRLRPSGEAGPIASHFTGFARYQSESAWTWEHMALTRARPVAGDAQLCRRISEVIAAVLCSPRDREKLVIDVADMRRRIADENARPWRWDLRNRQGGLIDLEFIVQFLMLRDAASAPQILHRGTAEAIAALGDAGLLPPKARHELGAAAVLFRNVQEVLALLGDGSPAVGDLEEPDAATLAACVGAIDFARLDADITDAAARVRSWYDRLIGQPARRAAQERGEDAR